MRVRLVAAVLALGVLTACGSDPAPSTRDDSSAASPSPATTGPSPVPAPSTSPAAGASKSARAGQRVIAAKSDFGPILFGPSGQAIYLFDVETTSRPRCYGECAEAWPPVLTDGAPVAGKGVQAALLGTTPRRDGTTQVTYDGHPLYYYAHEREYEVKCHDVFLNGGNWYAVAPNGRRAP